jgi:hypothetical protein
MFKSMLFMLLLLSAPLGAQQDPIDPDMAAVLHLLLTSAQATHWGDREHPRVGNLPLLFDMSGFVDLARKLSGEPPSRSSLERAVQALGRNIRFATRGGT